MEHKAFQVSDKDEAFHRAFWLESELSPACRLPGGDGTWEPTRIVQEHGRYHRGRWWQMVPLQWQQGGIPLTAGWYQC